MSSNSSSASSTTSGGVGFFGLLTICFIVLRLLNVINWSWWWVISPLLIPLVIVAVIFIGFVICLVVGKIVTYCKSVYVYKKHHHKR